VIVAATLQAAAARDSGFAGVVRMAAERERDPPGVAPDQILHRAVARKGQPHKSVDVGRPSGAGNDSSRTGGWCVTRIDRLA